MTEAPPYQVLPYAKPKLRVFRKLNEAMLSDAFVEKVGVEEGTLPWVDADYPRDLVWTEEIMDATIGAALVNEEGEIVAEFDGPDGWKTAERAKSSARLTFSLDFEEPKTARKKSPTIVDTEDLEAGSES